MSEFRLLQGILLFHGCPFFIFNTENSLIFILGSEDSNQHGSGLRELIEQLMIIQWENARVSSERPLALVIVKLRKTAKLLANYLARYPELAKRNVKTTFVDGNKENNFNYN